MWREIRIYYIPVGCNVKFGLYRFSRSPISLRNYNIYLANIIGTNDFSLVLKIYTFVNHYTNTGFNHYLFEFKSNLIKF